MAAAVFAQDGAELQPFLGMKDQFELSLPAGWSVFDQGLVLTGKPAKTGLPVVFAAEPIDGSAMMSGNREAVVKVADQLAGVETGRIAGFMLDRLPARRGMSCSGFDRSAQRALLELVGRDPMFGPGRTVREAPRAEAMPLGGCQGLRLQGKGTTSGGDGKNLDVFAVSDGEVVYFFKLLNVDEHREKNLATLERVLATLRLTAAPAGGR
ncbi:MAG: hypothetical protein KF683_07060 [Rubrivivax sp.]|nr:hypothetical protein [Rubrivivax sp.]